MSTVADIGEPAKTLQYQFYQQLIDQDGVIVLVTFRALVWMAGRAHDLQKNMLQLA